MANSIEKLKSMKDVIVKEIENYGTYIKSDFKNGYRNYKNNLKERERIRTQNEYYDEKRQKIKDYFSYLVNQNPECAEFICDTEAFWYISNKDIIIKESNNQLQNEDCNLRSVIISGVMNGVSRVPMMCLNIKYRRDRIINFEMNFFVSPTQLDKILHPLGATTLFDVRQISINCEDDDNVIIKQSNGELMFAAADKLKDFDVENISLIMEKAYKNHQLENTNKSFK